MATTTQGDATGAGMWRRCHISVAAPILNSVRVGLARWAGPVAMSDGTGEKQRTRSWKSKVHVLFHLFRGGTPRGRPSEPALPFASKILDGRKATDNVEP